MLWVKPTVVGFSLLQIYDLCCICPSEITENLRFCAEYGESEIFIAVDRRFFMAFDDVNEALVYNWRTICISLFTSKIARQP